MVTTIPNFAQEANQMNAAYRVGDAAPIQRKVGESVNDYYGRTGYTGDQYGNINNSSVNSAQYKPPTVLSSGTINDKVLPELNSKLNYLSNAGQRTGADGVIRYADGSIVPQNEVSVDNNIQSTQPVEDPDAGVNSLIEQMKASLDANTKAQIDQIHQNFEARRSEQQKINDFSNKAREASLLYGGTPGGSARYAQDSSTGIQTAQFQYGLNQINDLNNEEMSAVNAAKAAQQSGNFQLMERQLAVAEKRRDEKQAAAAKVAEQQASDLKTLREKNMTATMNAGIADQFKTSTDPATILRNLRANGDTTTTLKDIKGAINDLTVDNPDVKAVMDIMGGLARNGAPDSVKEAVSQAKTANEAFIAAGDWLQEAQGKAGEYLAYQRSARAAGKTPVSWETYFEVDQKSGGSAGPSVGVASGVGTPVLDVQGKPMTFTDSEIALAKDRQRGVKLTPTDYKAANTNAGRVDLAAQSLPKYISPAEKVAQDKKVTAAKSVSEFTKSKLETLNKILENPDDYQDATGANRSSLWNFITMDKTDIILDIENLVDQQTLSELTELKKTGATLGAISEKELGILQSAATKIAKARKENWLGDGIDGYNMSEQAFKEEIEKMRDAAQNLLEESKKQIAEVNGMSTADSLLASDDNAEAKISAYLLSNPDKQEEIQSRIQDMEEINGGPVSSMEFLEAYPEYQ